MSPCPFPTTITITPRAPPKYIYIVRKKLSKFHLLSSSSNRHPKCEGYRVGCRIGESSSNPGRDL